MRKTKNILIALLSFVFILNASNSLKATDNVDSKLQASRADLAVDISNIVKYSAEIKVLEDLLKTRFLNAIETTQLNDAKNNLAQAQSKQTTDSNLVSQYEKEVISNLANNVSKDLTNAKNNIANQIHNDLNNAKNNLTNQIHNDLNKVANDVKNNISNTLKSKFTGLKAKLDLNGGWDHGAGYRWEWFRGNLLGLHRHFGWEYFRPGDSWTSLNDHKKHFFRGGWMYQLGDKTYATKMWLKLSNRWYWFDKNGYVNNHAGWEKCKHGWAYSLGTRGYYTSTTRRINGHVYWFDSNAYAHLQK